MSKMMRFKIKVSDINILVGGLKLMGIPEEHIQQATIAPLTRRAFMGKVGETVEVDVLISNQHMGFSADLGFKFTEDSCEVLVDDYDNTSAWRRSPQNKHKHHAGRTFSDCLPQWYAAYGAMEALENEGMYPEFEVQKDGRVRVFAD